MGYIIILLGLCCMAVNGFGQVPDNLVVEGVPPIPPALRDEASRYLEFRTASLLSWHPVEKRMLILTRFADAAQLHLVEFPGGARKQITFLGEPVAGGAFRPKTGEFIVFAQDKGGGEFYQLYRLDLADARITLLTDGQSRNTSPRWSRSGGLLAYSSTRRNGRDTDIYAMDPSEAGSSRLVLEVEGGGWFAADWSDDETKLLVIQRISINESYLWIVDVKQGTKQSVTPPGKAAYADARFGRDNRTIFVTTDLGSEFRRLCRMTLDDSPEGSKLAPLTAHIDHDVEAFELSPDKKVVVFTVNEGGTSVLRLADTETGRELPAPKLPPGVIQGLEFHEDGRLIGFTFSSARSPGDAYSFDMESGKVERWTESEAGGLKPESFVEPQTARIRSFDGLEISAFVYEPPPRFEGKRPVLVMIHGGPESQARPSFLGRVNYFLNEMGIALVVPNVRGSSGYGKTFLTLDNGFKREDSVRDIGAVLDWIATQPRLDAERVGVMGGSYGGYMVLASMIHFGDRLRAGVDIVGISNFLTFLRNTQDYRRDLRRVEYGDERDPEMREFLRRISPSENVSKIKDPLFVIQGLNDPRVPVSESEQMVQAVRKNGGDVWYLLAKDEGHGFAKKRNQDFQFLATILFLERYLGGE